MAEGLAGASDMKLEPFKETFDFASLIATRIETRSATGKTIETGTGFWFRRAAGQNPFLVTNWHIVTGRKPSAPRESDSGAVPIKLVARVSLYVGKNEINAGLVGEISFDINDETGETPRWLEHPVWRHRADVVALQVGPIEGPGNAIIRCIGDEGIFDGTPDFQPRVTDNVFLLGYPWGLAGGTPALPIYKRGSIATEPGLAQNDLPRFLIDCRTARGMSGAPVIVTGQAAGLARVGNGFSFGQAYAFVGIYSGRLTVSDLKGETNDSAGTRAEALEAISEIGIVWRRDVLSDLINAPASGTKLSELLKS